jgi:predicted nuclease of predicted toxin-antitoxin system
MKVWLDAQVPPALAPWLNTTFGISSHAVRDLGLRDADDQTNFQAARDAGDVVILSKDSDFVDLVLRLGSPPQILWLTCSNVTNRRLRTLLDEVLALLASGVAVVEVGDR